MGTRIEEDWDEKRLISPRQVAQATAKWKSYRSSEKVPVINSFLKIEAQEMQSYDEVIPGVSRCGILVDLCCVARYNFRVNNKGFSSS